MAILQITSIRQEVQTIDEGAHLAAGVSYWLKRDFRLNEEHPPLIKLLAALPVVLTQPKVSFDTTAWNESNQWQFAREFFYQNGNNADKLFFLGRLPMIALSLLLGLFIYFWANKLANPLAGLLALAWYIFDPNFLAHGRYITTDVPVALGVIASLYFIVKYLENSNWRNAVYFSAIFGLTQVTKFSAVFLWLLIIIIPIIWFVKRNYTSKKILGKTWRIFYLAIIGTIISITLVYAGQIKQGKNDPWINSLYAEREQIVNQQGGSNESLVQKLIKLSDGKTKIGKITNYVVKELPVPGWSYFKGLALVINHDYWGHLAYLDGQYSNFGWWYYFPAAFLVKTPFATLIIFLLSLIALSISIKNLDSKKFQQILWIPLVSALLYFLWSLTSHINLGLRHIYPVYPPIFILVGIFIASVLKFSNKILKITALLIFIFYTTTSFLAYPNYTAYFSELIGGSNNGPNYLVDSNIDWGQDLKKLKNFLTENNIPYVCMSYFGQAEMSFYNLDFRYIPNKNDPHEPNDVNCVIAISVTSLLSEDGAYWWLKKYEPDARIGGSIYVYDFRNSRSPSTKVK
ncbi:MAG: phospholipid carrier-dependent glycosyltransferase [Patescibacteria group bacterium]|jgi:hypothetical protein